MSRAPRKADSASRSAVEGTTRVVGILGNPVEHSMSPRMHNAAYAALGLDYVYVPFRAAPDRIRSAVLAMHTLGIVGFNVTVPYKRDIVKLVDRLTPTAAAIGAVNTVFRDDDDIVGDNTDGAGFTRALLSHGVKLRGSRVLVIGAGGSARAVLHALGEGGASDIILANRTVATASRLAREFGRAKAGGNAKSHSTVSGRIHARDLSALADEALLVTRTLVVNCTPVGLKGGPFLDYRVAATPKSCVHFDLAYAPGRTPFLAVAHRARRATIDGRHMLVHQGAQAFRRFTGRKAPIDVMLDAVGLSAAKRFV